MIQIGTFEDGSAGFLPCEVLLLLIPFRTQKTFRKSRRLRFAKTLRNPGSKKQNKTKNHHQQQRVVFFVLQIKMKNCRFSARASGIPQEWTVYDPEQFIWPPSSDSADGCLGWTMNSVDMMLTGNVKIWTKTTSSRKQVWETKTIFKHWIITKKQKQHFGGKINRLATCLSGQSLATSHVRR